MPGTRRGRKLTWIARGGWWVDGCMSPVAAVDKRNGSGRQHDPPPVGCCSFVHPLLPARIDYKDRLAHSRPLRPSRNTRQWQFPPSKTTCNHTDNNDDGCVVDVA